MLILQTFILNAEMIVLYLGKKLHCIFKEEKPGKNNTNQKKILKLKNS